MDVRLAMTTVSVTLDLLLSVFSSQFVPLCSNDTTLHISCTPFREYAILAVNTLSYNGTVRNSNPAICQNYHPLVSHEDTQPLTKAFARTSTLLLIQSPRLTARSV